MEELRLKVHKLEEKSCSCPNSSSGKDVESDGADKKLQAEVMWLKRDLEEHLRTFKNVFSNADMLASSDATVELDKLWMLLKNRGGKKDKRQRGEREGPGSVRDGSKPGEEGKLRSRRDTGKCISILLLIKEITVTNSGERSLCLLISHFSLFL